jgi:hypothetical protein
MDRCCSSNNAAYHEKAWMFGTPFPIFRQELLAPYRFNWVARMT